MTWEVVEASSGRTERLSVPGGWLYRTLTWIENPEGHLPALAACAVAMCFVPDPPFEGTVKEVPNAAGTAEYWGRGGGAKP